MRLRGVLAMVHPMVPKVVLVDDVLATGGTASACCELLKALKADIVGVSFLIELSFLKGREKLTGQTIHSQITY